MMDLKTCRFDGCGLIYKNLYELIHHIEEDHIPEIEKKKLQELEDLKHPKLIELTNGAPENEGNVNPPSAANQERPQNLLSQSIPLSLLCKLRPFPKGYKVFSINPKKMTMNFCQYRKRSSISECYGNERTSPLHTQKMNSNQFGSFQAPNAKRPARRISEIGPESVFQKDIKPNISTGSILPLDDRRYRCDVEGCKKAYKNTQGLRAHIRNTHNLAGSSPRLSPSEEGILSRQLPSTNMVSPLTTATNSQPVAEVDNRAEDCADEIVADYIANTTAVQQRQMIPSSLGSQRIQQQQQQQKSYTTSKYPCQHCPKTYKTIMNLNKHMQESHPKQVANTTVGQLISPIRSHSPRTLTGQSLAQKQILSSPSAMARNSLLVHSNGPSPTPISPSHAQQILVSSGAQHPQSPAHNSSVNLVPASPQHMSHVQSSNYGGQQANQQQQQYYVTTNAGQVLHQQNHPARGYSYQQEHQYSGQQQQIQPPSYSSATSSPIQSGTTIYVSQQQQSPMHLQQYTVSGAPSQQQSCYSSSSNSLVPPIEASNRIFVGRAGAQPPSTFIQQPRDPRSGGQQAQASVIHHRVHQQQYPYTASGQPVAGRQQQFQQRLVAAGGGQQQTQQASSNATTIRVSSLNPYHHAQGQQQQYVQVQQSGSNAPGAGIPVSQQQMSNLVQTVSQGPTSQPSYSSQMPSSNTPSSFVVRTSNHSYVKQSQQPYSGNTIQQPPQRYNPATSNPQTHTQSNSSSSGIASGASVNQSRSNNSSPSTQQYTQAPCNPHYSRTVGGQQLVLRSVSPSSGGGGTNLIGGPQVRMLAASGHNYAQSSSQHVNNAQYQQYVSPRARVTPNRVVNNSSGGIQLGDSQSYATTQVLRGGRTFEQGGRSYYSTGSAQSFRANSTSSSLLTNNGAEPAIAPTLQPQEPVQESYSPTVSTAPASSTSN